MTLEEFKMFARLMAAAHPEFDLSYLDVAGRSVGVGRMSRPAIVGRRMAGDARGGQWVWFILNPEGTVDQWLDGPGGGWDPRNGDGTYKRLWTRVVGPGVDPDAGNL